MVKKDIIAAASEATGFTQANMTTAFEAILETVIKALVDGDVVKIQQLGTFSTPKRKQRSYYNLHTGEVCPIPEHIGVRFTPSPALKAAVNKS